MSKDRCALCGGYGAVFVRNEHFEGVVTTCPCVAVREADAERLRRREFWEINRERFYRESLAEERAYERAARRRD